MIFCPYKQIIFFCGVVLSLLFYLGMGTPAYTQELRIAVASNFKPALTKLNKRFQIKNPVKITVISASAGKLYMQIVHGAEYDIFLSADALYPSLLEKKEFAVPNTRFTYAEGTPVLWSSKKIAGGSIEEILNSNRVEHIALANPKLAPYGAAAIEVMERLGIKDRILSKLIYGENIAQAFHFVASGNAEIGFIAQSQIVAFTNPDKGTRISIPNKLYSPVLQQTILLIDSVPARQYLTFLKSPQAKDIIEYFGYRTNRQ